MSHKVIHYYRNAGQLTGVRPSIGAYVKNVTEPTLNQPIQQQTARPIMNSQKIILKVVSRTLTQMSQFGRSLVKAILHQHMSDLKA